MIATGGTICRAADALRRSPALRPLPYESQAFAALALGDDRVFADERLQVQGDTALAHQFQRALNQLQPDWEAAMARRHIGDVPAHFLGQRIRNAAKWSRQAVSTMNANVEEYIHEESRTLPGRRGATIDRQHANRSGCPTPSMTGETSAWAHAGVHRTVPRW